MRKSGRDGKSTPAKEYPMSHKEPLDAGLEAQAQELAARIRARADDDILALARLPVSKNDAEVFGDTEFQARTIVHHPGAVALEERLKKLGYEGSGIDRPHCQQAAKSQGYRAKTPLSLLGQVRCVRASYDCGRCGQGLAPWDRAAGLTARSFTPASERLAACAVPSWSSHDPTADAARF
jgi:hypothetical protein